MTLEQQIQDLQEEVRRLKDAASSHETLLEFERFKFFREETRFEFNLLGQRLTWYVTFQSFLLTAFSIAIDHGDSIKWSNWFVFLLPPMGVATSLLMSPSIDGAIVTADAWILKGRRLLRKEGSLIRDIGHPRDFIGKEDENATSVIEDESHRYSINWRRYMFRSFIALWCMIYVGSVFTASGWRVPHSTYVWIVVLSLFASILVGMAVWYSTSFWRALEREKRIVELEQKSDAGTATKEESNELEELRVKRRKAIERV